MKIVDGNIKKYGDEYKYLVEQIPKKYFINWW